MSVPLTYTVPEAGWEASLSLRLARVAGHTRLVQRAHRGPLLVQRAFHPELPHSDCCHLYLVHPPGGVVAGDRLELDARLDAGAQGLITTPAATKFYRGAERPLATQLQQLTLNDATLEWLPQENIFFPDAHAHLTTRIRITQGSRFIGWEVACFGLPANGRDLERGRVSLGLELWLGERPLLMERLRVAGDERGLRGRWGLAGNPACGTLLAFPANAHVLHAARAAVASADSLPVAITLVDGVLVCRMLAARASQIREHFAALWSVLRPLLLGRAASAPRIWAT
jgi:urease accessory protein